MQTFGHHVPDRDRLSVLTAIILLAYALARFVQLPTRTVSATLFGSSIGFNLDGPFILLLLVAGLISTGSDTLMRSHRHFGAPRRPAPRSTGSFRAARRWG